MNSGNRKQYHESDRTLCESRRTWMLDFIGSRSGPRLYLPGVAIWRALEARESLVLSVLFARLFLFVKAGKQAVWQRAARLGTRDEPSQAEAATVEGVGVG